MINYSYESWTKTLWKDIQTDNFTTENNQFVYLLKKTRREVKLLKGFKAIEARCADMGIILSCISNLTSVKMQKRHWKQLSDTLNYEIDYESQTLQFKDMVNAKIHLFQNQTQELTDIA